MAEEMIFVCQNCGNEFSRWAGKCSVCGEWNSLKEVKQADVEIMKQVDGVITRQLVVKKLSEAIEPGARQVTGLSECDRVLGGGLVDGSMVLLGGEPGIGKSTLMLQLAGQLAKKQKVLYVSGEESLSQVAGRARRLGLGEELDFIDTVRLEGVIKIVSEGDYKLVVIDSIQTMVSGEIGQTMGSISQIKYCVYQLMQLAKSKNITFILIGHVTKDGEVAGPKILEHLVDVVIYFEGERMGNMRILRVLKNRYGAVDETGVMIMSEKGLLSVESVSKLLLRERKTGVPGSVLTVVMEGSRPFLVEFQAIVDRTNYGQPRRTCVGFDGNRMSMLLAVLSKRIGLEVADKDVYLNVVGGFKIRDRAADAAVVTAIASVVYDRPVGDDVVVMGEVGLLGELRRIGSLNKRINEAKSFGYQNILGPGESNISDWSSVSSVKEMFDKCFGGKK